MKSRFFKSLLYSLMIGVACATCGTLTIDNQNNNDINAVNADSGNTGQLSIYLYYYTYGGSYNRYKEYTENKFVYDSNDGVYSLQIVLFEGDYFAPNITGKGFAYYNDALSDQTKQRMADNNISVHTGGNQFHVNKSGTYKIDISSAIDDYSKVEDYYKIWDDSRSKIKYVSESVDAAEPLGNEGVYLIGNFDQTGFNGSRYVERRFTYNPQNHKYEFTYNLFTGDTFCVESEGQKRHRYYKSEYTDKMFAENNIGCGSDGNFICLKDGTYFISVDYKVEYLMDMNFIWSKEIESTIKYLGPLSPVDVRGNEKIILIGKINGIDRLINATGGYFSYDINNKQYKTIVYAYKNDYFCSYMQNKGVKIPANFNTSFCKQMCDGFYVDTTTISAVAYFRVELEGYYEIALGANVENLRDVSHTWHPHGDSYIRLLGTNINSSYVSLGSYSDGNNKVYASGTTDIQQYGLDGIKTNCVSYISLNSNNAKGKFLKLEYDTQYTNHMEVTNTIDDVDKKLEINNPINQTCYDFESGSSNESLGNACSFLSYLSSCFSGVAVNGNVVADYSNITEDQAKELVSRYSKLDSASKQYVDEADIASVNSKGEETIIHYTDIAPFVNKIITDNKKAETTRVIIYITVGFVCSFLIGFIALASKRKRSNKKNPIKEEENTDININI